MHAARLSGRFDRFILLLVRFVAGRVFVCSVAWIVDVPVQFFAATILDGLRFGRNVMGREGLNAEVPLSDIATVFVWDLLRCRSSEHQE